MTTDQKGSVLLDPEEALAARPPAPSGSQGVSLWKRSISPRVCRKACPVAVYSTVIMAAVGALLGLAFANIVGVPEVISKPLAAVVLVIILHPIALPYLLATVIAGFQTANGPSADAAWDAVFLVSFAPYLLFLCGLVIRRVRAGRRRDALHLASLVGTYVCVCEFIVLAQDTIIGFG